MVCILSIWVSIDYFMDSSTVDRSHLSRQIDQTPRQQDYVHSNCLTGRLVSIEKETFTSYCGISLFNQLLYWQLYIHRYFEMYSDQYLWLFAYPVLRRINSLPPSSKSSASECNITLLKVCMILYVFVSEASNSLEPCCELSKSRYTLHSRLSNPELSISLAPWYFLRQLYVVDALVEPLFLLVLGCCAFAYRGSTSIYRGPCLYLEEYWSSSGINIDG